MKAIFFIFVIVLWYNVESVKIRAIRRQFIQYQPPNRNIFPVQNQYYNWQYPNQKFPTYQNTKLVYSYIDPLGERVNMYGFDKGNIGAYNAYLNRQLANRGQNMYQIRPGSGQVAWWVNRGLIGQSGYQNWLNSLGTPTVKNLVGTRTFYKNLVNGGHDLNLSINRNDNSEGSRQDDYDIDIRANSVPNPEQGNYSVKRNILNDENQEKTFLAKSSVDGDQKSQFDINKEESGSLFSVTDHNVMTLTNVDVNDLDQNKLDIANEASLQDVANEVSTDNVENTGTAHDFKYGDGKNILTKDLTQNWADEAHSENTVTVSDWNSDNVKNIHVDNEGSVHPETALPEYDLTSPINRDIITDVVADNKDNIGTESIMAESFISTGHKSSVDSNGLNIADARLQKQLKEVSRNIDLTALLNKWSPLPHRNLYPVNRNNLNRVTNYHFLVNGHNRTNVKPRVHPSGLLPNQQQMIRYNMPWSDIYRINERPRPTHPYFIPRNIKWIVPSREKQIWAGATHSDSTMTASGLNSDNVKEIHADNEESVHPVTVIAENDLTSPDNRDIITDVEADNKTNTGTKSIMTKNLISTDQKSYVDRTGVYETDEMSRHKDITALLNNLNPVPQRNLLYPVNRNNLNWETKYPYFVKEHNRLNAQPYGLPLIQQQIIRYNMPRSDIYQINQRRHPTHPYFTPRNFEWIVPSRENSFPEQVNNLLSRICLNPNINVKPGYERFTLAKTRLDTLLEMLQMFGTRHSPHNIYKNVPPQNLDMEYDLDERRPFDFDYAEGAVQPNLYGIFPFLYQRPRKNNLGPIYFPGRLNRYRQMPNVAPRKLDIKTAILRPNEAPSNDANNANDITLPKFHLFKNNHVFDTTNQIGSLLRINSENIVRDGNNKPEASEKYVSQLIVDIVSDLVRFPSSKCHSENVAKLLEGIKDIVDALKAEHCEKAY